MSHHFAHRVSGPSSFRLMPTDDFDTSESSAVVSCLGAEGLSVAYTWIHPADGEQRGAIVIGAADDDGRVEAAWFDTWHQKPQLMQLSGTRDGERIALSGTYLEEWGWTIEIVHGEEETSMRMCNVVPESALAMAPADGPEISAGAYEVSLAEWR
ncbi:MAG: hypothetical protein Q4G67_01140 [Actinomycetia bacterium]|nr:hypothetical protein [Actinomycetes bacterium]